MDKMFVIRMRWVGGDRFAFVQVNTDIGAAIKLAILSFGTDLGTNATGPAIFRHKLLMEMRAFHRIELCNFAAWCWSHGLRWAQPAAQAASLAKILLNHRIAGYRNG
jgi:hypothetical protein